MKKQSQLGMNPGTASNRLVKDLLFKFATDAGHVCFRCGDPLIRESFSIEHKNAWLDSEDPLKAFFDLENIAFSHLKCNVGARRQTVFAQCGTASKYAAGCRCDACKDGHAKAARKSYTTESRQAKYKRLGC